MKNARYQNFAGCIGNFFQQRLAKERGGDGVGR